MNLEIDQNTYEEIAKVIHSDDSPVGIDAKKTHILILNKLMEIEQRLARLETERKNRLRWNCFVYLRELSPVGKPNKDETERYLVFCPPYIIRQRVYGAGDPTAGRSRTFWHQGS